MLNMRNKDVLSSLPLLASVLGDKYGVEVRIGGDKAATNGKVIFIPSLPMDADENLLALVRGYIDHESGHIRFTDHEAMVAAKMDNVTQFLWNCIEDWRIENKIAEVYPGCKQNLHWLLRRLFLKENADEDEERAEDHSPALSVLNFVLLTVRMWDLPEIYIKQQEEKDRAEAYFTGITVELEKILDRVRLYCPDTQTAITYAKEMAECIRNWTQKQNLHEIRNNDNTEPEELPRKKKEPQEGSKKESESKSSTEEETGTALKDLFQLSAEELPSSVGSIMEAELQAKKENNELERLAVAEEESVSLEPLSEEDRQMALRASNALKVRLHGLLQASVSKPSYLGRRGRLDTHYLYRLQTGNASVFVKEDERQGISTAVHILLDASGSMTGKQIHIASLACYAVAKALESIRGISVGVSIFPASSDSYNVGSIVRHGERVNDKFAVKAHGTTPLAEALWWVLRTLIHRKESRKIVLILTDGSPNNMCATERAISSSLKCGIEPYGIGILDKFIENLLPERCVVISTLNDLAQAMFQVLQGCLIGGANGRRN